MVLLCIRINSTFLLHYKGWQSHQERYTESQKSKGEVVNGASFPGNAKFTDVARDWTVLYIHPFQDW